MAVTVFDAFYTRIKALHIVPEKSEVIFVDFCDAVINDDECDFRDDNLESNSDNCVLASNPGTHSKTTTRKLFETKSKRQTKRRSRAACDNDG